MSRYPEVIINKYVWEQFKNSMPQIYGEYDDTYEGVVPFFPVSDNMAGKEPWSDKPYVIYDSFIKARTGNRYFYPVKSGQMMYSIKGKLSDIYEWRDFIFNVLDREDQAARDINEFAGNNLFNDRIYFHCINCHQVNYISNTSEQSGQRKMYSANLIIKYDYHIKDVYNN